MRPRGAFPADTATLAHQWMKRQRKKSDYRRFQVVYLAAGKGLTNAEIAEITGYSVRRVGSWLRVFRRDGFSGLLAKPMGGRHGANLTVAEETTILMPFIESAKQGGVLVVHDIHHALNAYSGKDWALASVYELLHRHNWRKIVPRRSHPKRKNDVQDDFKKNFGRRVGARPAR
jgi:transposase